MMLGEEETIEVEEEIPPTRFLF